VRHCPGLASRWQPTLPYRDRVATAPYRSLLDKIVRQSRRTIEETCIAYEEAARHMGEDATLSPRQLLRWIKGEVGRPRPVAQRVAEQLWGHSFEALLAPPVSVDRRDEEQESLADLRSQDIDDADLVALTQVLDHRGITAGALTSAELMCARLDTQFAQLGPDEVLGQLRLLQIVAIDQLRRPQTLGHQRRLVALTGRLAGLRAWACFDLDQHAEAERWYDLAVNAAQEAEEWSLGAWLLGANSLIPWHRRDHQRAIALIDRGIYLAGNGADTTTRAWLHALAARGRASLGDRRGFEAAYQLAEEAAEHSAERDRRHGMDFYQGLLDLRYYAGNSRLLLHEPAKATVELRGSLAALPTTHTKARAVLTLNLADAAVQEGGLDEAVDLARHALTATRHQPIMPILHQARRIRRLVSQRRPSATTGLDRDLAQFAHALTDTAARSEP
jgi:hypothetical protein